MLITKVDYRSSSSPSSHVVSCYRLVTNFQETNRQQETHARRDERTVISELHPISYSYCGWEDGVGDRSSRREEKMELRDRRQDSQGVVSRIQYPGTSIPHFIVFFALQVKAQGTWVPPALTYSSASKTISWGIQFPFSYSCMVFLTPWRNQKFNNFYKINTL